MVDQSGIADVIKNIQADVTTIVKGEIELAKAELLPQAKAAGIDGFALNIGVDDFTDTQLKYVVVLSGLHVVPV